MPKENKVIQYTVTAEDFRITGVYVEVKGKELLDVNGIAKIKEPDGTERFVNNNDLSDQDKQDGFYIDNKGKARLNRTSMAKEQYEALIERKRRVVPFRLKGILPTYILPVYVDYRK